MSRLAGPVYLLKGISGCHEAIWGHVGTFDQPAASPAAMPAQRFRRVATVRKMMVMMVELMKMTIATATTMTMRRSRWRRRRKRKADDDEKE